MLLSISLISITMLSAVVNAQYGGYGAGSQYTQQVQQYGQSSYQQTQQYGQSNYQQWQQPTQPGSGQWQQNGGSAFQDYQQQSSYTQAVSPSDQCGRISEEYDVIPFKTWGRMTESMKIAWGQQGCDQKMCVYWAKKYNVPSFENGGQLPFDLLPVWNNRQMECGFRTGPYTTAQCKAASERFNTKPLGIWGNMPNYARTLWTQGNCDVKMCGIWKEKYGVIKGQTYGSLPVDFKNIWDDSRLLCTNKI
ncbi:hypothetical protein BASA50_009980 [Batrachochytrium salamandrivorans]|uniref:Uncharacterized protein n=1 Tax=Batrachochytrium salamandrivorans TaxID=1357716 RepID=A0ABQ8EZV9_9FUNG|nr:hypothetical protein BASA50_009980 [Batrachochytrium salamandrivorans]KAH9270559.1 hypothetical protein BASA83_007372 [Batrachochytrium salamandrivorans]